MKEEAEIRTSRQTLNLISAFSNPRCNISVQEAVHNIMLIGISVATTLSLTKLKSGISAVHRMVVLSVLFFKYQ